MFFKENNSARLIKFLWLFTHLGQENYPPPKTHSKKKKSEKKKGKVIVVFSLIAGKKNKNVFSFFEEKIIFKMINNKQPYPLVKTASRRTFKLSCA